MSIEMSEDSKFTIPLKNLIALLVAVGVAATAYFNLTERVTFNEHQSDILSNQVEDIEKVVGNFIPRELVMAAIARQRELEINIAKIQSKIIHLEDVIKEHASSDYNHYEP